MEQFEANILVTVWNSLLNFKHILCKLIVGWVGADLK